MINKMQTWLTNIFNTASGESHRPVLTQDLESSIPGLFVVGDLAGAPVIKLAMEQGYDTVDANLQLGFSADRRDYGIGAQICRDLGLRKIRILTNNPKKVSRLEVYGIKIVEQIPLRARPGEHNINYLRTKKYRLGHMLDEDL